MAVHTLVAHTWVLNSGCPHLGRSAFGTLNSGCPHLGKTKIPFTPAPDAPEGFGVVYVLKDSGGDGTLHISSIRVVPQENTDPANKKYFYLVHGEYSWIHLKTGIYEAIYTLPATGEENKTFFMVGNKKSTYVSLSFANPDYVIIEQLQNDYAEKLIAGYKYWEYKVKDCTLTMACR